MSVQNIADILFGRTWWRYESGSAALSELYHWFNLFEGFAWLVFAGLVAARHRRHRSHGVEVACSLAFVAFAATDFREAWVQQSWLLWIKLLILIALFRLRRHVMRTYYPDAKLY